MRLLHGRTVPMSIAGVLLLAVTALLIWFALDLLLLVFTGVLLAVFLRTIACWVSGVTRLSLRWSLVLVVAVITGAIVLAGALYAPRLAEQTDQLARTLPQTLSDLTAWLREYAWGRWLLDRLPSGAPQGKDVVQPARQAIGTVMTGAVGVLVVLFTGLYLAIEPVPYVRGLLRLVPVPSRRRVAETLYVAAHVLRWWLVGQALAMLLVGLTMGFGLALIGVQLAFLLGVLAGVFEFIPFLGPLLALGPALMLGLAMGTKTAAYVVVLYVVVQTLEGYVLTPLVQRKVVELQPVVTITAQVALSWAAGPVGLLVAVPLVAVATVVVEMLYIEDRLRDRINPEFESVARAQVAEAAKGPLRGLFGE